MKNRIYLILIITLVCLPFVYAQIGIPGEEEFGVDLIPEPPIDFDDLTWRFADNWNYISGGNFTFNESKLVETITVIYNATSIVTEVGTVDSGDLDSITQLNDGDTYNVSEVSGAPGFLIYVNFTNVVAFNTVVLRGRYEGGAGHTLALELYRVGVGWEERAEITDQMDWGVTTFDVFIGSDFIDGGVVQFRINHDDNGIIAHDYFLDALFVGQVSGIVVSGDLAGLTGREDACVLLPDVFCKDGSKNATGNWSLDGFSLKDINDVSSTSFSIGANTLTTSEWRYLDGQDQFTNQTSNVIYNQITLPNPASIIRNDVTVSVLEILNDNGISLANPGGTLTYTIGGKLTHSSGTFDFDNDDLTTTGNWNDLGIAAASSIFSFTPPTGGAIQITLGPVGDLSIERPVTGYALYLNSNFNVLGNSSVDQDLLKISNVTHYGMTLTRLNVTGTSYLGDLIINADNITINSILNKSNSAVKVWSDLDITGGVKIPDRKVLQFGEDYLGMGIQTEMWIADATFVINHSHSGIPIEFIVVDATKTTFLQALRVDGGLGIGKDAAANTGINAGHTVNGAYTEITALPACTFTANGQDCIGINFLAQGGAAGYTGDLIAASAKAAVTTNSLNTSITLYRSSALISGNATDLVHLDIFDPTGGGRVNQQFGIRIAALSRATNNTGIWMENNLIIDSDSAEIKLGEGQNFTMKYDGSNPVFNTSGDGVFTFYNASGLGTLRAKKYLESSNVPDILKETYLDELDNIETWIIDEEINYLEHYAYTLAPESYNCREEIKYVRYCYINETSLDVECFNDASMKDYKNKGYEKEEIRNIYKTVCDTRLVPALDLGKRIAYLEGMAYELKQENQKKDVEIQTLKDELCVKDNTYSWCIK